MAEERYVCTACPGWGDHEFCALKTIVKDGKIDHTEKVQYTGPEADESYICQKGLMSWRQVYNKERLLKPLKRVGERGEGKWEEISWDQALDEIAEKLAEIREKYGPESVVAWSLAAGCPPNAGLISNLTSRFSNLIGATNPIQAQGLDNGSEFSLETDLGAASVGYFFTDPAWMNNADLVIIWGANPVENQHRVSNAIVEAKSKGAKVVDIGLVYDASAGYSDKFLPAKPGSDAALALAMAKIIVDDEAYDREFIMNKTVAPLLVNTETGKLCRSEDGYFFYAWNSEKGEVVPVQRKQFDLDLETTALTGCYEIDGVACKPAFQLLIERLESYTPEFQESVTGISAADCIELAHDLENAKAIFYAIAYGLRYKNQGEIHRAVTLLSALTGSFGPDAGIGYSMVTSSWPVPFNTNPIIAPLGMGENGMPIGTNWVRMDDFFRDAKEGKYKAFLKFQGNPVHQNPNRSRWVEDTLPQMELVVDYDIWMTDTGEVSDYVLPDCMPFEREDYLNAAAYGHIVLQEPAIEPVGDNKAPTYYISELAKRLGFGEYFDKDEDGWISEILANSPDLVNEDGSPITIEQLHEEKIVRPASLPKTRFNGCLMHDGFETRTGRLEFYAEDYAFMDEAIAKYRPSLYFPVEDGAKYPYQFFTGRQRFFMQSMFTEDPVMRELSGGKPYVRMNPVDAAREGLVAGDMVEVYNDRGHVLLPLALEESCPPGCVHVWFGWRRRDYEEGTYAEMTVPCGGDEANDELSLFWFEKNIETYGGMGSVFTMLAGAWDTLWDDVCAVRKVEK